jgi:hypothetical protein
MLAERDLVLEADLPVDVRSERKINAVDFDRTLAEIAKLNKNDDDARIEKLHAHLRDLTAKREQLAESVRRSSPRLAALEYPKPLDLEGTRQTLDAGTVLLSYSVGPEQTELFVVQPKNTTHGFLVYTLPVGEKALRNKIKELRRLMEKPIESGRIDLNLLARTLYDLLIKPAEAQIVLAIAC